MPNPNLNDTACLRRSRRYYRCTLQDEQEHVTRGDILPQTPSPGKGIKSVLQVCSSWALCWEVTVAVPVS